MVLAVPVVPPARVSFTQTLNDKSAAPLEIPPILSPSRTTSSPPVYPYPGRFIRTYLTLLVSL